jgi:DNA-binding CsgD family transcriptional regulator
MLTVRLALSTHAGGAMTSVQDGEADPAAWPGLDLTPRETAILCLIAGGHTNTQAAKKLNISHHTVAQHIAGMLRRAQASSRGELIARAYTTGVLAPDIWPPRPSGTQGCGTVA